MERGTQQQEKTHASLSTSSPVLVRLSQVLWQGSLWVPFSCAWMVCQMLQVKVVEPRAAKCVTPGSPCTQLSPGGKLLKKEKLPLGSGQKTVYANKIIIQEFNSTLCNQVHPSWWTPSWPCLGSYKTQQTSAFIPRISFPQHPIIQAS